MEVEQENDTETAPDLNHIVVAIIAEEIIHIVKFVTRTVVHVSFSAADLYLIIEVLHAWFMIYLH